MRCLIGALATILTLFSTQSDAQSVSVSPGRWFFGRGIGVGFADVTYVDVSPFAGYRATDRLSIGARPSVARAGISDGC